MKKEQIIDFLYGEMSDQEKSTMLNSLESDPDLSQRIDDLTSVRHFLQSSNDVSVQADMPQIQPKATSRLYRSHARWWAIAASLLMLMVAGKLLDVRVKINANEFAFSYGSPLELTSQDLAVQEQLSSLQTSLVALQDKIEKQQNLPPVNAVTTQKMDASSYEKILSSLQQTIHEENQSLKQDISEQLQSEQNAHIESLLSNVMEYWDAQRREDLKTINDGLINLAGALSVPASDLAQNVNY